MIIIEEPAPEPGWWNRVPDARDRAWWQALYEQLAATQPARQRPDEWADESEALRTGVAALGGVFVDPTDYAHALPGEARAAVEAWDCVAYRYWRVHDGQRDLLISGQHVLRLGRALRAGSDYLDAIAHARAHAYAAIPCRCAGS